MISKAKTLQGKYEAKLEFPLGRGSNQYSLYGEGGEGVDNFWIISLINDHCVIFLRPVQRNCKYELVRFFRKFLSFCFSDISKI